MRASRAVAAAAGAALAVLTSAPPATAAPVACGDTLSGDVVLTADLVCTGTLGLRLTDGTTLDLAGHRVVGAGVGTGIAVPPDGEVTVRHGVVAGWDEGVAPDWENPTAQSGLLMLDDLTLRDNQHGVRAVGLLGRMPQIEVSASRFVGNDVGIDTLQAQGVAVSSSRFTGNRYGLYVTSGMSSVEVVGSVLAHNTTALGCSDGGGCALVDSTLRDNGTGVQVDAAGGAELRGSTLARNGVGAGCNHADLRLEDDDVRDNGTGVRTYNCSGSVVGSTFLRNDVGLRGDHDAEWIEGPALQGNTFRRNGDGVLLRSELSTLEGNTAIRNERWGIYAPLSIDLGGNTARGNGNEPQCVGVVCADAGPVS